jgi:diguanylate cyclase (GGDEF)-like protein/PAS domain S-box-containing protein
MTLWRSVNLRIWLPALAFLLFTVLTAAIALVEYQGQKRALKRSAFAMVWQEMTRLQWLIEHEGAAAPINGSAVLISRLGALPEVKALIAVDANAKVWLSHSSAGKGRPAAEIAPDFDVHEFQQVLSSRDPKLRSKGDPGGADHTLTAYFPLRLPAPAGDARGIQPGALYLLYDLNDAYQQLLRNVLRDGGVLWTITILATLALLFVLQILVSGPARQLQRAARQFLLGQECVRLQYRGQGEFAQIADAFNVMAERLAESHRSLLKQKNLYSLLSATNEIIHRLDDPEALLAEICRIAIRYEGISLAWAARVFDDGRAINIRTSAGIGQDRLCHRNFHLAADEKANGPLEQVVRSRNPVVVDSVSDVQASAIGYEAATAGGIRSAALFPIVQNGAVTGLLTLYADTNGFFTTDIAGLLNKMAQDIAYALDALESERRRRKAERILAVQRGILQAISEGSPLSSLLADLCGGVEALLGQEACCAVLLVQQGRLRVEAAPNLPDEYRRLVNNMEVGLASGICGKVAALGEEVYSAGVDSESRRGACLELMCDHGLRACWSIPIKSSQNRVLGVFAIYYTGPNEPDAERREIVGRFVYLAGIAIERRQAEEALREREENLSITLNSIGDAVIVTDRAGLVVRMNPVAEKLTGWPFHEAVGRPLAEVLQITDSGTGELLESPVGKVLRDGQVMGLASDTALLVRDGSRRQIADCAAPIRNKHGEILGAILVFHDVTEEYRMQFNLRHSEMLLKHHIENTPLAAIVWDTQCRVAQWNSAAERIFGYSVAEAVGQHALQLIIPPDAQEPALTHGVHAFLDVSEYNRTVRNLTREGRTIFCEWYHTPLRDDSGALIGVASLAQDVTERRLMDELMHSIATEAGGLLGEAFFQSLVQQLAAGMQADFAYVGLLCNEGTYVQTVAVQAYGQQSENFCYLLADTPCEKVVQDGICLEITDAPTRFPQDALLAEMGVDSYAGVALKDAAGKTIGLLGILHSKPITYPETVLALLNVIAIRCSGELQRMKAEEELRLAATAFETHEAILITDSNANIIRVNKAFTEITGYSAEEVIGRNPRLLSSGVHDVAFYAAFWKALLTEGQWQGEVWNRRKNGEIFPQMQSVTAVRDQSGKISQYVSAFLDISDQKKAEMEIQRLAYYDTLTNLPNRRLLMERLQQELSSAARHQCCGALLFLDLDNFKTINDALGHSTGDELLKQVAERLSNSVRAEDTIARLGGDEFVVLLPELDNNTETAAKLALSVAEKIRNAIGATFDLLGREYQTSTSIGITVFPQGSRDPDELLKQADTAMYRAKASGRNDIRYYLPDMQVMADARLALEKDLRHALGCDEFCLYYQPQFDDRRNLIGAESLLRWRHPQRGMVSPADFIPIAEDAGLVVAIGEWVLLRACEQFKNWIDEGLVGMGMEIAVNVSPRQFHRAEFVDQLLGILAKTGMPPNRLVLELTEGIVVENMGETIEKMRALKAHGIHFSIDDFGTGYSSLAYLKRLPIDQLKIDRSFIQDMCNDANDRVIVETIVAMAQHLRLDVIAEGVETEEQLRFLEHNGCTAYQGFHFSKPIPSEAFGEFLEKRRDGRVRR